MTIRRFGRSYNDRLAQGTEVPSTRTAAPVSDPGLRFSEHGYRFFTDVGFPAHRDEVYWSALAHGAPPAILKAIQRLPARVYGGADQLPDLYEMAGIGEWTRREKRP